MQLMQNENSEEISCAIQSDWIELPSGSCMGSYTENDVIFNICCKTSLVGTLSNIIMCEIGKYFSTHLFTIKTSCRIIIKDVPKMSLEPGKCFNILKNTDEDNLEVRF